MTEHELESSAGGKVGREMSKETDIFVRGPSANYKHGSFGTQGHQQTVDLLAATMRGLGCDPVEGTNSACHFDLAWEFDKSWWVAEIKSLTPENETCQIRLGLGQVLGYRHTLEAILAERVDAVLALEGKPATGAHWMGVCRDANVTLTWPPFAILTRL